MGDPTLRRAQPGRTHGQVLQGPVRVTCVDGVISVWGGWLPIGGTYLRAGKSCDVGAGLLSVRAVASDVASVYRVEDLEADDAK